MSSWLFTFSYKISQTKEHWANDLITSFIIVVQLQNKSIWRKRPLNWEPPLLSNCCNIIFRGYPLCLHHFTLEFCIDICVYSPEETVHLWKFVCLYETYLQLLELFLDLSWHQSICICSFWSTFIIQLDLLISRSLNRNTDLQITSDRTKIFSLRIDKSNPLVVHSMLFLVVDVSHIEFVHANHLISEHTLVHDFHANSILFNLARVLLKIE